jgi:hypothetical protein
MFLGRQLWAFSKALSRVELIALKSVILLIEWLLQVDFTSVKKIYESYRTLVYSCLEKVLTRVSILVDFVSMCGSRLRCRYYLLF